MNSYIPKPWHFLTVPTPLFAIGLFSIYKTWDAFGSIMIALGVIATFIIGYALLIDVFVLKADTTRYLFDSAKHLDRDRTNDLLIALGLKPMPEPQRTISVTVNKQEHGVTTNTKMYPDIPASPAQLEKLAIGLLLEGAPFSRREWTGENDRAKVFTQDAFNTLAEYCNRKKLREQAKGSNTFQPTDDFEVFLKDFIPSPTPQMQTA